jgi:hypothetical protein
VHNHPGDEVSLSYGDFLFSHRVDTEVYVITHHEGVYYSGRVLDGARLQRRYQLIHARTAELLEDLIADAKLCMAAADFYEYHVLNAALAELDLIHYSATGFDTPPALALVIEKLVSEFKYHELYLDSPACWQLFNAQSHSGLAGYLEQLGTRPATGRNDSRG